ncbi:Arc family DNA-binding protein [Halomonas sp. WWR20]
MAAHEQTNVRLPSGIKERLRQRAKQNHRSLNAEIAYRLELSLAQDEQKGKGGRSKT